MNIRKALVALTLAFCCSHAIADDGNALLTDCRKAVDFIDEKPVNNAANLLGAGRCIGMAQGIISTVFITEKTPPDPNQMCLPNLFSPYQAVRVAEKYMAANPELLDKPAGSIFYVALLNAYPCKKKR